MVNYVSSQKSFYSVTFFSLRYLQEYTALGTAGGMYHFRDQILVGGTDMFFVINGDVCGQFPLIEMLQFQTERDDVNTYTILGTEVRIFL